MSSAVKKQVIENAKSSAAEKWNRRILLVDDEPEILKAYVNLLEEKTEDSAIRSSRSNSNVLPIKKAVVKFEVVSVSSYDTAIEAMKKAKIENKPFAMGFFDVRLGEQRDGVELAREVKSLDPRMGIVFVTAYNDRSLDSIASVLGSDVSDQWDFVNKPFNGNEIVQKARNLTTLWNLRREKEEHAQALAELNRLILQSERVTSAAAVARGVTHEFGNLLMQIIGKAEISRNKSEAEMREAFDRIVDASLRASEILDRFNNLSDNKSEETRKEKYSVQRLVQETLDLVGHLLRKENVQVVTQLSAVNSVLVNVHSTSILQVFVNLLINSIHALENSDQKKIFISAETLPGKVFLTVRDTGPGAPAEIIDRLTEAFFTTKGSKGTGLGLAICKEIIEIDHHGEFQIGNSSEGGFQVRIGFNTEG